VKLPVTNTLGGRIIKRTSSLSHSSHSSHSSLFLSPSLSLSFSVAGFSSYLVGVVSSVGWRLGAVAVLVVRCLSEEEVDTVGAEDWEVDECVDG
jgi:hypothetical protein